MYFYSYPYYISQLNDFLSLQLLIIYKAVNGYRYIFINYPNAVTYTKFNGVLFIYNTFYSKRQLYRLLIYIENAD